MPESLLNNWDALLREGLLTPPTDFHARVMARLTSRLTTPATQLAVPVPAGRIRLAVQALALATAAIAGLAQLAIFSFGIWSATAAG